MAAAYVRELHSLLNLAEGGAKREREISSVFFGGGTPSLAKVPSATHRRWALPKKNDAATDRFAGVDVCCGDSSIA
jgi:hypothetical protein